MAHHLYGYNPSYGGPGAGLYSAKSAAADPYLPDSSLLSSSRYLSSAADRRTSDPSAYSVSDRVSSLYLNQSEGLRLSSGDISAGYLAAASRISGSQVSWSAADVGATGDLVAAATLKRPTEALYHQTLLGSHNTIGQTEAWFSTDSLAKRPRFETAINLPIYPQRPGEKDCAHYMLTRTCKFGDSCKFDHPIWVPEGGIPDWKEVQIVAPSESLPERPGEPDCPYFLKTQKCKFGFRCKFNHPKDKLASLGTTEDVDVSCLPERPSEPPCAFYMKTGKCKFGGTCKFHHPKDIQLSPTTQGTNEQTASLVVSGTTGGVNLVNQMVSVNPALMHNSKGLPVRPGEVDCPFYMKTGSCKYGPTCRYNHPDRYAINPPAAAFGHTMLASPASIGAVNPASMLGLGPAVYPQRPGQIECDFYMKTGTCKYGELCKFHHPIDRSAPTTSMLKQAQEQNVKLTLAGLPRREGTVICPYYLKTGTCSFGATCKFDHPPPGEVMAMATTQGTSTAAADSNRNKMGAHAEQ